MRCGWPARLRLRAPPPAEPLRLPLLCPAEALFSDIEAQGGGRLATDWLAVTQCVACAEALLQLGHQLRVWVRRQPVLHCECQETRLADVEADCQQLAHHCLAAAAEGYRGQLAAGQSVPTGTQGAVLGLAVTLGKLAHAGAGAGSAELASCLEMTAGWREDAEARRWARLRRGLPHGRSGCLLACPVLTPCTCFVLFGCFFCCRRLCCCLLSLSSAAAAAGEDAAAMEQALYSLVPAGEACPVERGRALALRSCANLGCPTPQGGSEREAFERGRKCSAGCGLRI